jgi:hypothetical protein
MNVCQPAEPLLYRCADALAAFGVCAFKPDFCAASTPKSGSAGHLTGSAALCGTFSVGCAAWPGAG